MYQVKNGQVINKLFHPDRIPEGWYDSPKAAKAALEQPKIEKAEEAPEEAPKKIDLRTKEGRALKAQLDDNSPGTD